MIKVIQKHYLDTLPLVSGRVAALGMFDGLHTGHIKILRKAVKLAKGSGLVSCATTFSGMDRGGGRELYTIEERMSILEQIGIDELLVLSFPQVKDLSPEDFMSRMLLGSMRAKAIVSGFDYTFGKGGQGDVDMLAKFAKTNDIRYDVVSEQKLAGNDRKISATWMREALAEGDAVTASKLCGGRNYFYTGRVEEGKKLGRQLGFPTANVSIPEDKFVVKRGVYAVRAYLGNRELRGIADIGNKPTVEGDMKDRLEVHIFDFDEDIYGAKLKTELVKFIRPEKKFGGLDELKAEVGRNIAAAKEII